jgi:hypothetical protein
MGEILDPMNNLIKIENEHDAEIQKIISTDNDNKRKREIEELSVKLNHQLKEEELQYLCQRYKNMHIETMFHLQNEHDETLSKIYTDYAFKIDENEKKFYKDMSILKSEENQNLRNHIENIEKIKSQNYQNAYLHEERLKKDEKEYNNNSKKIDLYYKDLEVQRNLEASKINKQFENDKITIEKNSEIVREKNKNIHEENKQINDKNFEIKMKQIEEESKRENRKLDIMEKMLPMMMMNPMMMQNPMMLNAMMMNQTNMQNQCQNQTETCPGTLPVVKNDKDSMGQNQMNFKPMAFPNMFNPMLFSQMMNVK